MAVGEGLAASVTSFPCENGRFLPRGRYMEQIPDSQLARDRPLTAGRLIQRAVVSRRHGVDRLEPGGL